MKKIFVLILGGFLIAGFFFYIFGGIRWVRGPWMDRTLSLLVSAETGQKTHFYDVRLNSKPNQANFGMMSVTDRASQKIIFVSSQGSLRLISGTLWGRGPRQLEALFENAVIMEDLLNKSPILHWASREAFDRPIEFKAVRIVFLKTNEKISAHLLSCRSEQLVLNGGVLMRQKHVIKVHALIFLPEDRFEKVPKEMRARMIPRAGGWRGVRLIYGGNFLRAVGKSGPFFQARWNHGQA